MTFILMTVHLLPFISSFFFMWAYRKTDGKSCSLLCAVASVIYLFYNYNIGATMAFMIGPLGIIYILSTAYCGKDKTLKIGAFYMLAVLTTFFIGYGHFWDIFALLATTFSTSSLFFQNNEIKRKLFAVLSSSCWVFYACFVDAYGMIITTALFAASTLHSVWPELRQTLRAPKIA